MYMAPTWSSYHAVSVCWIAEPAYLLDNACIAFNECGMERLTLLLMTEHVYLAA